MASSRILSSKAVNKLQVNRLDAQAIRSDNIIPQNPSYLFSAVFNNGNFTRDSTGGTLTFTRSDVHSIIQFSDRPFRQTDNIDFESFVSLFGISDSGSNTFAQDPPNGVLVHEEEQRTYIIRLLNSDTDSATFSLELLPGESHNLTDVNGRMSLFVDDSGNTMVKITSIIFKYLPYIDGTTATWTQPNKLPSITFSGVTDHFIITENNTYDTNYLKQIRDLGDNISLSATGINPFYKDNKSLGENYSKKPNVMYTTSFMGDQLINTNKTTLGYYVYAPETITNSLNIEISYNIVKSKK